MAGRGARVHVLPASKVRESAWREVDELCRVRKLFPDAHERLSEELFRAQRSMANKRWLQGPRDVTAPAIHHAGGTYQGALDEHGQRHGWGAFTDSLGHVHVGEWRHGRKHGYFEIAYTTGERFEGHFEDDRRHGEGTTWGTDGSRYHGDYQRDYRHGRGMYWSEHEYYTLQKLWMRRYQEGRLLDEHEIYTDTQRDAEPLSLGYGTHVDALGRRYEGDFVRYQRHGKGRVTHPDGRVELGEWVEGRRQGVAMLKVPDTDGGHEYWFHRYVDDELVSEERTDQLNWDNFFWYDEGGFASHN